MGMVEIKTAELEGSALDWAIGEAEGEWLEEPYHLRRSDNRIWCNNHSYGYCPSTDWSQGGPLIEKYTSTVTQSAYNAGWWAHSGNHLGEGETPLIAACRAIVAAKLGDTVSIPTELLK